MSRLKEDTVLKIEHLYSVYDENKESQFVSLCDINYDFQNNKIYCIIGNSGSGKSTLVSHFNGLIATKYGTITLKNRQMGHLWNFENLLYGILDNEQLLKVKRNHYLKFRLSLKEFESELFVFASKVSQAKAKLIIEAYYKINVVEVKIFKLENTNLYGAFTFIKPHKTIRLHKNLNEDDLALLTTKNITKPSFKQFFALKKIKKIKELRKQIGMVFQFPEYQLFKDTIEKDIMFGPLALGANKDIAKQRAKKYLNELGLDDSFLVRNPFGLSGGQKRRVAIAGILAIETPILIFDEPTAGLDPVGEREMIEIILNAKANKRTVFVITHTMDHVLEIADEIIVLNDGEILKSGSPYEVFLDANLLASTSISAPKVIKTINDLVNKNHIFKKLYDFKPRTVSELATGIENVLKGGN